MGLSTFLVSELNPRHSDWICSTRLVACRTVIGFFISLRRTTDFPIPCLWIEGQLDGEPPIRTARIVNGRVVYEDQNVPAAADRDAAAVV